MEDYLDGIRKKGSSIGAVIGWSPKACAGWAVHLRQLDAEIAAR